eukprot:9194145-Pyramimonas_sp.AAC.1
MRGQSSQPHPRPHNSRRSASQFGMFQARHRYGSRQGQPTVVASTPARSVGPLNFPAQLGWANFAMARSESN